MFNVKKSEKPAHVFLYTDEDIVSLIKADFFYKCYLCEEKTPRHLEVDHFYPQAFFPGQIHDWDNLICICEKCNKIRPKKINTGEDDAVLHPCRDDVESLISLKYNTADYSVSITSAYVSVTVINSINILHRIHNGIESASFSFVDLRKLIASEIAELEDEINNLNIYVLEKPFREKIRRRLSRQSAFYAIKKTFITENNPELLALLEL